MKVDLLIIATNKYTRFLSGLLASAHKHFLPGIDVTFHVFTDQTQEVRKDQSQYLHKMNIYEIEHKPWPYATLHRFHFFKQYIDNLRGDYQFYIDADTLVMQPVTRDILSARTVVAHCGFVNGGGSWETNGSSTSYVPKEARKKYYGGGFWGFSRPNFTRLVHDAVDMLNEDRDNSIIPVWHDESVLNKWLTIYPPYLTLTPSYHYPENNARIVNSWKEKWPCIILLLDKNHQEVRS